mgnify:CR=1 FL=1
MSRNYYFIAAGILLIAAAGVHWASGTRSVPSDGGPEDEFLAAIEDNGSSKGIDGTHALVDPLIPPIQIDGLYGGHDPHGPSIFDPDSLAGRIAATADFSSDSAASFHAHGEEVCASGCAASSHPTKELTRDYYHELLEQYSTQPMDESSFALESLLYFGRQTQALLKEEGDWPLDPLRSDFLREQLRTTHAKIEIRLIDEHGEIRTWLPPTRVPFDRRHEFHMEVNNVQPLITSGTVKRVGLYHLWTRL